MSADADVVAIDCQRCPAFFTGPTRREDYAEHRRQEHPVAASLNLRCVQCDGVFGSAEELDRHGPLVHGPALCPDCTFRAPNRQGLGVHRKRVHGMSDRPPGWTGPGAEDVAGSPDVPDRKVGQISADQGPAEVDEASDEPARPRYSTTTPCPHCGLTFTPQGLAGHIRHKHKDTSNPAEPRFTAIVVEDVAGEQPQHSGRASGTAPSGSQDRVAPSSSAGVSPAADQGHVVIGVAHHDAEGRLRVAALPKAVPGDQDDLIRSLREALNRWGWHAERCGAYYSALPGDLASEADDGNVPCSCGFRGALASIAGGAS